MKNKILVSILLFGLLACSLTACKKEEAPKAEDAVAEEVVTPEEDAALTCSFCNEEKECGTYTANGKEYVVCDDCYEEFLFTFGLNEASIGRCSLCEEKKVCGEYIVNDSVYVVCPSCSNEFITAFEDEAEKNICSACE